MIQVLPYFHYIFTCTNYITVLIKKSQNECETENHNIYGGAISKPWLLL